jgi:ParB-like chromosome segregation protein Spo0J
MAKSSAAKSEMADSPVVKTGHIDPAILQPNTWNVNICSPDGEAKLAESIRRLGVFKPVIVRELDDGTLQILGGEHRVRAALRMGLKSIPFVSVGHVSDQTAKEISLVDNSRYGTDDTLQLAGLLETLGTPGDLALFLPFSEEEFASIFSTVDIALEDLDLPEEDELSLAKEPPLQTHQIMRFKVPVEDAGRVTSVIERIMKTQRFTESDSLSNAGDALVYLCGQVEP